ncbi:MAG: MFS transporter [Spirochaetes bacterium]|nr:MFS transporter [Spirochaetota bacterium]
MFRNFGLSNNILKVRFLLVSVVVALSLFGDALLYAVLPARPADFRVLIWQIGILLGANRLIRLFTNEISARILKRYGLKKPLVFAIIIGGLTTAGYAVPLGFWWLLLMRIIWGSCWSVFRAEGYISALALSGGHNRGKVIAAYQTITRVGSGGGVLIGGFLSDLIGIPETFILYGIITISGLIPACLVSLDMISSVKEPGEPESQAGSIDLKLNEADSIGADVEGFRARVNNTASAVSDNVSDNASGNASDKSFGNFIKRNILIWYGGFSVTMAEQMITNLTGRLVVDKIMPGISFAVGAASLTGILLGFKTFGTLAFVPLMGILSDKFGRRKVLLITLIVQIVILGLLIFSGNWLMLSVVLALQFMAAVSSRLGIYTLAGDRAAEDNDSGNQALYMNRFATFVDLGTSFGPVAAYSLYSCSGFVTVILAGISLLVPLVVLLAKKVE